MGTSIMTKIYKNGQSNVNIVSYPQNHFLGIPPELRQQIWEIIYSAISMSSEPTWFERPINMWEGLEFSCRQIRDEVANLWPRMKLTAPVTAGKLHYYNQMPITARRSLRRITIEVSDNETQAYYRTIAAGLQYLEPSLSELRLFFVKTTQRFHHQYAPYVPPAMQERFSEQGNGHSLQSLHFSNRKVSAQRPPFEALTALNRITTLVIANDIYPLNLGTIMFSKPRLTYLRLSAHPQLILDPKFLNGFCQDNGSWTTKKPRPPPIRRLYVSANAMVGAIELYRSALNSLEEVTWTVPSTKRQPLGSQWFYYTTKLIHTLRHAPQLHTLRLYLHDAIDEEEPPHADLIHAIRFHLCHFRNLRTFEFRGRHANIRRSHLFAREIVLEGLPASVEHFYTSESLIPLDILQETVRQRYLGGKRPSNQARAGGKLSFIGYTHESSDQHVLERSKRIVLKLNGLLQDRAKTIPKEAEEAWQVGSENDLYSDANISEPSSKFWDARFDQ